MKTQRAILKYLGDRKWRKLTHANIAIGNSFLVYIGNRKENDLMPVEQAIEKTTRNVLSDLD